MTYEPTKNVIISKAVRQLFLRSKERAEALKRDKYTCQHCFRKQSRAKGNEFKVQVHHKLGVENTPEIIKAIREYLLCDPQHLLTLCRDCHLAIEGKQKRQP